MVTIKKVNEQLEKKNNRKKDCPRRLCVTYSRFLKREMAGRAACWILDLIRVYVLASA